MTELPWRPTVGAIIINNEGRLLVGKRSRFKKTEVGKWQFPQGGVNDKEDPYQAVVREIKEEVGLNFDKEHFVGPVEEELYQHSTELKKWRGQRLNFFIFYWPYGDLSKCNINIEKEPEFDEVKFMNWEELLIDGVESKKKIFERLKELAGPRIEKYLEEEKKKKKVVEKEGNEKPNNAWRGLKGK